MCRFSQFVSLHSPKSPSSLQEHLLQMQVLDQRAQETNLEHWLNPHCPPRCDRNYGSPVWLVQITEVTASLHFHFRPQMYMNATLCMYKPSSPELRHQHTFSFFFHTKTNALMMLRTFQEVLVHRFNFFCILNNLLWCLYFITAVVLVLFLFFCDFISSVCQSRKPQEPVKQFQS